MSPECRAKVLGLAAIERLLVDRSLDAHGKPLNEIALDPDATDDP